MPRSRARTVSGTSTHAARRARLAEFGTTLALDPSQTGWLQNILEATGGEAMEVIVDQVTGDQFEQTMQVAALGGRIVNFDHIGALAGVINVMGSAGLIDTCLDGRNPIALAAPGPRKRRAGRVVFEWLSPAASGGVIAAVGWNQVFTIRSRLR